MILKKLKMSISDATTLEQAQADLERANANIEYISMMTDIEIPTDESEAIEE